MTEIAVSRSSTISATAGNRIKNGEAALVGEQATAIRFHRDCSWMAASSRCRKVRTATWAWSACGSPSIRSTASGTAKSRNQGGRGFRRKAWRIRRLSEPTDVKGETAEKYRLIHDALQQIHDVALIIGDMPLAESLQRLQEWVQGKCQGKKRKPR